ncbi:aldo/keto reductase [Neobacillus mesonae]|uniref:aldo/keto reductase n=1 Tax=Neobacillus mesonae TaxID=1193713 RepID=UPI0020400BCC|nr:aldo/keto reductase [Neobacillus mesonae]MCM3567486.1 aldo/keto reductase [Neobacillus mesonae]
MKYTTLKKTDMKISTIGVGTNKIGGHNIFQGLDESEGKAFLREAIHLGMNFIDTADIYGPARSEELVGEVLQNIDVKREDLIVATKGGVQWGQPGGNRKNNDPAYLRSAVEDSLKRLQLDYIDLYYLHWPDNVTPFSESIGELVKLKEEGKIRAIGVSNLPIEQLKEAAKVTEIAAMQSDYNMFDRTVEKDVLPFCAENQISFIPCYPLASGLLGGKYKVGDPVPKGLTEEQFHQRIEIADKLKPIASKKGTTLANLALAWLLAQDGVDSVIPGGRGPDHARGTAKAADVSLSAEELRVINEILTQGKTTVS